MCKILTGILDFKNCSLLHLISPEDRVQFWSPTLFNESSKLVTDKAQQWSKLPESSLVKFTRRSEALYLKKNYLSI